MGVRVLHDQNQDKSCLYDSVTETAFGPVMYKTGREEAQEFLDVLGDDARTLKEDELGEAWESWVETRRR